ncbi:MAG: hypothetical protein ACI4XE_00640 [Acutalibacteraceae bacterium]
MKTIGSLLDEYNERENRIYLHFKTDSLCQAFLLQAENEGFTFCDGVRPTERETDSIIALNADKTINYVGCIGHIAFAGAEKVGSKKFVRIEYDEEFEMSAD